MTAGIAVQGISGWLPNSMYTLSTSVPADASGVSAISMGAGCDRNFPVNKKKEMGMNQKKKQSRLTKGVMVLGVLLLAACGGGGGEDGIGGIGGGGGTPDGFVCSSGGAIDSCTELQRIGGLSRILAELTSVLYTARYSNAYTAAMSGGALPCPDGGTYTATVTGVQAVSLSFSACQSDVGTIQGTAVVTSKGGINVVKTDDDEIVLDLTIGGTRYVGGYTAVHYALTHGDSFNFGLKPTLAPASVTPAGRTALPFQGFGGTLTRQADGSFHDAGDVSVSFQEGTASWHLLSGPVPRAAFRLTTAGGSANVSVFSPPFDGEMRYLRTVAGVISVEGTMDVRETDFSTHFEILAPGSGSTDASATWEGAFASPLYRGN